ncbi:hypothetical protein HRbin41_00752 [bacterium HR41]|nr:hypothetical protein HRbin41_00752 [bacterium HR41]
MAALLLINRLVDRRLAQKNMRSALIALAIALLIFAASWIAGLTY